MDLNIGGSSSAEPQLSGKKFEVYSKYTISFITLIIGLGLGYLFFTAVSGNKLLDTTNIAKQEIQNVILPNDAVQIQKCADHKGALFIKSKDIPVGPVYMMYNGKVIGMEFMLSRNELLSGKGFDSLRLGSGMQVDHLNVGFLSNGHEGYPIPHYHVDLYVVTSDVEKAIKCPKASSSATGSATFTSASPSSSLSNP